MSSASANKCISEHGEFSVWWVRAWVVGFLLLGCFLLWKASPWSKAGAHPSAQRTPTSVSSQTVPQRATRNIEDVRVGQKVWADNPEVETSSQTQVDPQTWKLLRLRAESIWEDGTVDDIHVETLQPPEWLAAHQVEVGAMVPLPLDLVEMGLPENLMAKVLAIERCPAIESGPGRVVLTTVNHLNPDAYGLTVENGFGEQRIVYPTGLHKLYRDGVWTSVEDLRPCDEINALGESVTVVSLSKLRNSLVPKP